MTKQNPVLSFGVTPSPLAKAQTQYMIDLLQKHHRKLTCQMTVIPTPFEPDDPRATQETPYLCTSAAELDFLQKRLLAGEFRVLVARAVDLVNPLLDKVTFGAVAARRAPFDALLNRQGDIADDLPEDAVIGVMNRRSLFQMESLWPEMDILMLNCGLDEALEVLMRRCDVDALVVPAAVAEDMNLQGIVSEIFFPEMMLPGAGQGILVAMVRVDDDEARSLLEVLHSQATAAEMEAENAFMNQFASDQDLPVSVMGRVKSNQISVTGAIGSIHNVNSLNRATNEGPISEAGRVGSELACSLLASGSVFDVIAADFPDGLPDEDEDDDDLDDLSDLVGLDDLDVLDEEGFD